MARGKAEIMKLIGILISLLGLDSKVKGALVGYRTYLVLALVVFLNLGPAFMDLSALAAIMASLCGIAAAILGEVLKVADGKAGILAAADGIKAQWALVAPLLGNITAHVNHLTLCLGALAGMYFKAGVERKATQRLEVTAGPAPVEAIPVDPKNGGGQ